MISTIIAAAGKGTRSGMAENKILNILADGKTLLEHAVKPFDDNERINEIIIACSQCDLTKIKKISEINKTKTITVIGGETRSQSVKKALEKVSNQAVLIHDAARPFIDELTINRCIDCLFEFGSAIAAIPCTDTIGETDQNKLLVKADRKNKYLIQTPQGFFVNDLKKALAKAEQEDCFTDESGAYCKYIAKAKLYEGNIDNIKLTYPRDFENNMLIRTGTGYDLHRLQEGRKLILGGIEIQHNKGLLGHSDADVLVHTITDALLSAAALKDIGCYFPDNDPQYKDICSMRLLEQALAMLHKQGYVPYNLSAVIMAEQPKLNPYVDKIKENLSHALNISCDQIGISCTTCEKVGLIGNEQAIAVHASCTIKKIML